MTYYYFQKLSKEFKETEPDLFNVLKVGEELSTDPQVSEDVREAVTQDVLMLRENHTNVAELLKSQREKYVSFFRILYNFISRNTSGLTFSTDRYVYLSDIICLNISSMKWRIKWVFS